MLSKKQKILGNCTMSCHEKAWEFSLKYFHLQNQNKDEFSKTRDLSVDNFLDIKVGHVN